MFKMEHAFSIVYHEGERAFYISSINYKGEGEEVCTYIDTGIFFGKKRIQSLKISWQRI